MSKRIAIVEDEPVIRQNYTDAFRKQGYEVVAFADRPTAEQAFRLQLPELALLDIGLGDDAEGGFELCRKLRAQSATLPIIFLTARDSDLDTISGLRLGADDYLTKDISLPNLCARVAAFFRRIEANREPTKEDTIIERGHLKLDMNRFTVSWRSHTLDFSLTEFWIIHALALYPGHVKSREKLMEVAHIVVDGATITSHIKRVRKKFQQHDDLFDCIDTVYGAGYRWLDT